MSLKDAFLNNFSPAANSDAQEDTQHLTHPFILEGTDEEKAMLTDVVNRIVASDMGRDILEEAGSLGYKLRIGDLGATVGVCRSQSKELIMSDKQNPDRWVSTLVHEARHAGQINRGAIAGYNPCICMKNQLPEKRLMEADAVACSVHVCQELFMRYDYMPLSVLHHDYTEMVDAYENAQNSQERMTNEEQAIAITACALNWYENEPRKMAYEMSHVLDPLSRGETYDNETGIFHKTSLQDSIKKICKFGEGSYFSEPSSVLEAEKYSGLSQTSTEWVREHTARCTDIGAGVDPTLKDIPVYRESDFVKGTTQEIYGRLPEVLPQKTEDKIKQRLSEKGCMFTGAPKIASSDKNKEMAKMLLSKLGLKR